MANTLGIDFAADHKEMEDDLGNVITWNGASYPCVAQAVTEGQAWESDGSGYYVTRILAFSARVASIGTTIATGDKVTFLGDQYRIIDKQKSQDGTLYRFTCEGLAL